MACADAYWVRAFVVRVCMGCPAVPLVGEPVFDNLPEAVPGGHGGYLRQGVHTGQQKHGA